MASSSTSNLNKNHEQSVTSLLNTSHLDDFLLQNKSLRIQLIDEDEWIAVKSLNKNTISCNTECLNTSNEIINIVSISVEKEKIAVITREHNRIVTDDEYTKQWYGVYTIEQLYSINERIIELDNSLNDLYPEQLRPIKGIFTTYFSNKLNDLTIDDLQDNELCKSFELYLNNAFKSLGKRLYIDILFNDISSDQYFEIYAEFNLKRIKNQIDKLLQQLFPLKQHIGHTTNTSQSIIKTVKLMNQNSSLNDLIKKQNLELENQQKLLLKQQLFSNLKHILMTYSSDDCQIECLMNLFVEYHNNQLKPLKDLLEIAKLDLIKFTNKLINQEKSSKVFTTQSTSDCLIELKNHVESNKQQIFELSNKIDAMTIEHKQNLIDLNTKLLHRLKQDCSKFKHSDLNLTNLFDFLTKKRKEKFDEDLTNLKIQLLNLQLNLNDRKKEEDFNKISIKIKMLICSEEELVYKRNLAKLNENETVFQLKEKQIKNLLNEPSSDYSEFKIEEIQEIISKINLKTNDLESSGEESEEDEYDDSKFHDAFDDPLILLQQEQKEVQLKNCEINLIKKKITEIGSKKSGLRISLNKLLETEKAKQQESESDKLNETNKLSQTFSFKSAAIRKQEDELQSKENLENRKKALQRIKDHKNRHIKDSFFSSSADSLTSTTYTQNNQLHKQTIKKQYVPKSKQRIIPPPPKPRPTNHIEHSVKNAISFEIKLDDLNQTDLNEEVESNLIDKKMSESDILSFNPSISSSINIENNEQNFMPPVPPPLPPLFMVSSIIKQLPISDLPSIPSLPLNSIQQQSNIPIQLPFNSEMFKNELKNFKNPHKSNNKIKSVEKKTKSFDINEIKNFKFKNSALEKKEQREPLFISQNVNPWDSLMSEIRSNAGGTKLKKVIDSDDKSNSKHMKFNTENDYNGDSNLVRDLNQILSQRSQFFKEDDDEDCDSTDDESWNGISENYN